MLGHSGGKAVLGLESVRFNLLLLAVAVPTVLVVWTAIGELLGDVYESTADSVLTKALVFIGSMVYLSIIFYALFLPGLALFLLLLRLRKRVALSRMPQRLLAVVLSPAIGLVFVVIPAIPDDRDDAVSGWLFVFATAMIVALLVRLPVDPEGSAGQTKVRVPKGQGHDALEDTRP